ncbi:LOW QUALITY PROTEIN: demethylmenaquinone methyltransferase [Geomicrobium sp. JCM 19039]|nr:LOW QUALITY PROTEIN: demethylmenaquinone methyltransferase [Geomicrobium sp. JCM 19039]
MSTWESFKELPTTAISDGLSGLNHMSQGIFPLTASWHTAGRAFTVSIPGGENVSVLEAIGAASPGDVLVIDGKGERNAAIAGDFIIGLAKTKKLGGIVVNGVIRDLSDIQALNFPVFCVLRLQQGKRMSEDNCKYPFLFAGLLVHPGDLVVADRDGVVVVPKSQMEEVYRAAMNKLDKDEQRANHIGEDPLKVDEYIRSVLSKQ